MSDLKNNAVVRFRNMLIEMQLEQADIVGAITITNEDTDETMTVELPTAGAESLPETEGPVSNAIVRFRNMLIEMQLSQDQIEGYVKITDEDSNESIIVQLPNGGGPAYVTNGLIHRWDAIDNTASGHDSSVTVWKDLIGSNDLTMHNTDYASWTENALNLAGNNQQYLDCLGGQIGTGEATVEIVLSPQTASGTHSIVYFGSLQRSAIVYADKTFSMNGDSSLSYPIGVSEATDVHYLAAAYDSGFATGVYYVNGETAQQGGASHNLTGNLSDRMRVGSNGSGAPTYAYDGLIHAIRIYDRKLSAAEIAQNYAVDVARFGLGG